MRRTLAGSEASLQEQVVQYLRMRYPDVLFRSDMGGVRLTMSQAVAARRVQKGRAWPDLFIAEPLYYTPAGTTNEAVSECGLFLELKKDGTCVYKKDGTLTSDPHVREQAEVLEELRKRGYAAHFAIGLDEAISIIDGYLSHA